MYGRGQGNVGLKFIKVTVHAIDVDLSYSKCIHQMSLSPHIISHWPAIEILLIVDEGSGLWSDIVILHGYV